MKIFPRKAGNGSIIVKKSPHENSIYKLYSIIYIIIYSYSIYKFCGLKQCKINVVKSSDWNNW